MKEFFYKKIHSFVFEVNLLSSSDYLLLYKKLCIEEGKKEYYSIFEMFENCDNKYSITNSYNEEIIGLIGVCEKEKKVFLLNKTFEEVDFKELLEQIQ